MKIVVAKQDLEEAIKIVKPCLGNKGIHTHFVLRALQNDKGEWRTEILSSTQRLIAGTPFVSKVEIDDDGLTAFTVEADSFMNLLGALPDAALTFTFDGTETLYDGPRAKATNKIVFESLNPKKYPYWEKQLEEAELKATVPASALLWAFDRAKLFILDDEIRRPDLCLFEARDGVICATNTKTVALVRVLGMDDCTLRVKGNDAKHLSSFLSSMGDDDIEIYESKSTVFYCRADGTIYGETRFNVAFPSNVKVGQVKADPIWWDISVEELRASITVLESCCLSEDNRLRFKVKNGVLTLTVVHKNGKNESTQDFPLDDSGEADDAPDLPDKGFLIDRSELRRILTAHEEDTLRMGVNPRGSTGFVHFAYDVEGVDCHIISAWLED